MKTRHLFSVRRALLAGALAVAGVNLLQGCVPLVFVGAAGAGALVAADRRSAGAQIDDESIEWKVRHTIRQHFGIINHINITSYNRNVLLTGEVESEQTYAEVQRLTGTVTNVRGVVNELVVAPPSSASTRANDSMITSNVKTRFLTNNTSFSANHVKVVTEAGAVFLLGIVTQEEGEQATEIARTSRGVRKVVKVFEYTSPSSVAVEERGTGGAGYGGGTADTNQPPDAP